MISKSDPDDAPMVPKWFPNDVKVTHNDIQMIAE